MDKHVKRDGRAARLRAGARRRRRCSAPPAASTWSSYGTTARALRQDRLEEPQALGQQPVRAVPGRVHPRGDPGRADDLRPADQAAVLPDLGRRRPRRSSPARTSSTKHDLAGPGRRDRRAGDDHRLAEHLRRKSCIKLVGYDMTEDGRAAGLRAGRASARRTSRSSSCTTASRANELLTYEALGLCGEGEAGELIDRGDTTYGGNVGRQPVGRADLQGPPARRDRPGAVRRADLAAARHGRQAPGRGRAVALQHNIGLGGAAVVTMYGKK